MTTFRIGLIGLLLAGLACAQSNSSPVLKPRGTPPVQDLPTTSDSSGVAPDAPVITIKGLCDKPAPSAAPEDCKTLITRAEFEKVIKSVQPNMQKAQMKRLAAGYVQLLILAGKAHELGLDQGPEFDEQMYLQRLQVLARLGGEHLQKEAAQVSDAEIESYFKEHGGDYKTISYDKIYVPKQKQMAASAKPPAPNDPDAQKQSAAGEAEMKEEADKLRARAAAGEDFVKLQQDAYDSAGLKLKSTLANTHVDKVRKTALPPGDASIFELKKGEVSQVFNDPQAYMIYKVGDSQPQELAEVKDEISRSLQNQKLRSFGETLQKAAAENTTYDDAYFATPAPPSLKSPGEPSAQPPATQGTPAPGKK